MTMDGTRSRRSIRAHKKGVALGINLDRIEKSRHDGLSISNSLLVMQLLDSLNIQGCDHCADLRYALIAYIQGLIPVGERYVYDTEYSIPVNGRYERHLRKGQED